MLRMLSIMTSNNHIFLNSVFPSEDELLRRLFDGYDLDARPTIEAVPVEIGFYLDKLDDVVLKIYIHKYDSINY